MAVHAGEIPQRGVGVRRRRQITSLHGHPCRDDELGGGIVEARFHEDSAVGARRRNARGNGLFRCRPGRTVTAVIGSGSRHENIGLCKRRRQNKECEQGKKARAKPVSTKLCQKNMSVHCYIH